MDIFELDYLKQKSFAKPYAPMLQILKIQFQPEDLQSPSSIFHSSQKLLNSIQSEQKYILSSATSEFNYFRKKFHIPNSQKNSLSSTSTIPSSFLKLLNLTQDDQKRILLSTKKEKRKNFAEAHIHNLLNLDRSRDPFRFFAKLPNPMHRLETESRKQILHQILQISRIAIKRKDLGASQGHNRIQNQAYARITMRGG